MGSASAMTLPKYAPLIFSYIVGLTSDKQTPLPPSPLWRKCPKFLIACVVC